MERGSRSGRYVAIAALVLVCTVLGTLGGAVAGGVAGYLLARREVRAIASRPSEQVPDEGWRVVPGPAQPSRPEMPRDWPFGGLEGERPFGLAMCAQVVRIVEGSPAEAAGLRTGDRITAVDGKELAFGLDLTQALSGYEPGDRVELAVVRASEGDRTREEVVQVTLGENPDDPSRPYLGLTYRMVLTRQDENPSLESG